MSSSLLVWGLSLKECSQAQDVMISHDCFGEVRACIEPDWQVFGKRKDTAADDLIQLAELLGCRGAPHLLPASKAVCLARGMPAILAAVDIAGGVNALAAADEIAAACLAHCLIEVAHISHHSDLVPAEVCARLVRTFRQLGPQMLKVAAAETRAGMPGFPQHAYAAVCLTQALLETNIPIKELLSKQRQGQIASDCIDLLHAVADAMSKCLSVIGKAAQQHRLSHSPRQQAALQGTVAELEEQCKTLQMAAYNMLPCLRECTPRSGSDVPMLLDTIGHLIQQCVVCVEVGLHAAAAGLQLERGVPIPGCLHMVHDTLRNILSTVDKTADSMAARVALYSTVLKTLHIALERLSRPQHVGVLLGLSLLVQDTLPEDDALRNTNALTLELPRALQLAADWLATDEQQLLQQLGVEHQPFGCGMRSFGDQLSLLADINASFLAEIVVGLLTSAKHKGSNLTPDLKTISALAAVLKVASGRKCRNVRNQCPGLVYRQYTELCHAPGLINAGESLLHVAMSPCCEMHATAGAVWRQPWAIAVMVSLLDGGLGSFWLGHAEAAAQALTKMNNEANQRGHELLGYFMHAGIHLLQAVWQCMTPQLARTLAKAGAVPTLLQALALPLQVSSADIAANGVTWEDTSNGLSIICTILAAILSADAAARAAVLRDGSWDAAAQRVRSLQPPQLAAEEWSEQQQTMLNRVTAVLRGSGSGGRHATGDAAAATNSDAVAAAERAMQEMLADEQPVEASSLCNKAISKRARKKAAKVQAATATHSVQAADHATVSATASTAEDQTAERPGVSAAVHPATADAVSQSTDCSIPDDKGIDSLPAQQLPASSAAAAESEWWRCPLSGRVMRDPVLCGNEGYSFERDALEQWLAANPGVHPLSRQPLPPGEGNMLSNHALRNMIQQLHLD